MAGKIVIITPPEVIPKGFEQKQVRINHNYLANLRPKDSERKEKRRDEKIHLQYLRLHL